MKIAFYIFLTAITIFAQSPKIISITPVDKSLICLEIIQGDFISSRQIAYLPQPNDSVYQETDENGNLLSVSLYRNNQFTGYLAGKDRNILTTPEYVVGDTLDLEQLDNRHNYKIRINRLKRSAKKVYRKSKPIRWSQPERKFVMQHFIYLQLGFNLKAGMILNIEFENLNLDERSVSYIHDPENAVNQAIHVTQIGFHPQDDVKRAFLSVWLGNGGTYKFSKKLNFFLINEQNGQKVFSGKILPVLAEHDKEMLQRSCNLAGTNVYRMDFSGFQTPGAYRIYVQNIGCSLPFEISPNVWQHAFQINMNGFYNIRSGIELNEPFTDFKRQRCYHPDDKVEMYLSTTPLMNTGNGLNALGTDNGNFGNLVAGKTDQRIPAVAGGYQDAGDWDRRIQHLECSYVHLELYEMYPDFFDDFQLKIPENKNNIPDIIDEAIYNIDFYRRLQDIDGGIRGGIEATSHPVRGETSYQESLDILVYAPGIWSSYAYAALAAKLAFLLENINSSLAAIYAESATRAMRWAESRYPHWQNNTAIIHNRDKVIDQRNLAALQLYRLTGEWRWHELFLQDTILNLSFKELIDKHSQTNAVFLYARLGDIGDNTLQDKARQIIMHNADESMAYAEGNAFGLTAEFKDIPMFMGYFSAPQGLMMCQAFYLTNFQKYLRGILLSTQFSSGANPMNMMMTTGFKDSPLSILHKDSNHTGQKPPDGITVYGPFDIETLAKENYWGWPIRWYLDKQCEPSGYEWPSFEGYFDIGTWPAVCEWTPQQTMVDASFVWGFLAAQQER